MRYRCFFLLLVLGVSADAQPRTDAFLEKLLLANPDTLLQRVIKQKDEFRLQVIYTQINRDRQNRPSFKNYYLNADSTLYFNPASTVKLPLALLALEKLNDLNQKGVDKFTPMQFDSNYNKQIKAYQDSSAQDLLPSIAQYIRKAFLVSDNDAYNRLYEFVGQQTINRNLHAKGYKSLRITRQFLGLSPDENRHTNPIRFITKDGRLLYAQPAAYNKDSFYFGREAKIGKAYYNNHDSLINQPIDFTMANNLPLEDLQQLLQSTLFPNSVPAKQRFGLRPDDYHFLYQYLSQFPSETNYPKYDSSQYYDSYVKFYFRSGNRHLPPYVRVFNKVGWAYGFLIDVSYVVDFKNKVEFMLSSTVYANSDGILNDDKYDYETVGWPFLYELGQTVYRYELKRPRKVRPDLSNFKIAYDHRDLQDQRPTIKDVDN